MTTKALLRSDPAFVIYYCIFAIIFVSLAGLLFWLIIFDIPETEQKIAELNARIETLQHQAEVYDYNKPEYADISKLLSRRD